MAGLMRVPRTRGALSGILLLVLGAWGALIPFIGPYFDFAFTPKPNSTWYYTLDRLWLSILPGAAVFLGGLIVLLSANRAVAIFGGWLAAVAGVWFVIGAPLSMLGGPMPSTGTPTGGTTDMTLEMLFFFFALGALIIFLAALALGRFFVVGVRETRQAEAREAERADLARARTGTAMGTTAAGTTAGATTAGTPVAGTTADRTWTEPATTDGRHSAPGTGPAAPTAPPAAAPRQDADVPPMAPPAEAEKVGAGAGRGGHDHHRRLFHRRHHDES